MFFRSTMMIYRSETYSWKFLHFSAKSQFAIISWKFHELTFFYHVTQNIFYIEKWLLSSFRSIQTLTFSYTSHHRTTCRSENRISRKKIWNFSFVGKILTISFTGKGLYRRHFEIPFLCMKMFSFKYPILLQIGV